KGKPTFQKVEDTERAIQILFQAVEFHSEKSSRKQFLLQANTPETESAPGDRADQRLRRKRAISLGESRNLSRLKPHTFVEAGAANRLRISAAKDCSMKRLKNESGFG